MGGVGGGRVRRGVIHLHRSGARLWWVVGCVGVCVGGCCATTRSVDDLHGVPGCVLVWVWGVGCTLVVWVVGGGSLGFRRSMIVL